MLCRCTWGLTFAAAFTSYWLSIWKQPFQKRIEAAVGDVRTFLREKKIRHAGITRSGNNIEILFRSEAEQRAAFDVLRDHASDMQYEELPGSGNRYIIRGTMSQKAMSDVQEYALKQNVATLHNRINELGVAEPVIAQQGADRIVVQPRGSRYSKG